jgi:hypothetical protein
MYNTDERCHADVIGMSAEGCDTYGTLPNEDLKRSVDEQRRTAKK